MLEVYPWQTALWQQVSAAWVTQHLPHALILTGPLGLGQAEFATNLASAMLCETRGNHLDICGHCKSCYLTRAGNHPDLKIIGQEDEGRQIKVEQIRDLIEFINLSSHYGQYKIVIIDPADHMNKSAANTLLKTLEEPPGSSMIILITSRYDLVPATIKSRCQKMHFHPVYDDVSLGWLSHRISTPEKAQQLLIMANGAPLKAINLDEEEILIKQEKVIDDLNNLTCQDTDPLNVAMRWTEFGASQVLTWIVDLMKDMAKCKLVNNTLKEGVTLERLSSLQASINQLDLRQLVQCHDLALHNYKLASGQVSFNQQGLLEDFIVYWQQINKT